QLPYVVDAVELPRGRAEAVDRSTAPCADVHAVDVGVENLRLGVRALDRHRHRDLVQLAADRAAAVVQDVEAGDLHGDRRGATADDRRQRQARKIDPVVLEGPAILAGHAWVRATRAPV